MVTSHDDPAPSPQRSRTASAIPRVVTTSSPPVSPSTAGSARSQSRRIARTRPVAGSVTTVIARRSPESTVTSPSGPVRVIRSSVSSQSSSMGMAKRKYLLPCASSPGVNDSENSMSPPLAIPSRV